MTCPHCRHSGVFSVDLYVGDTNDMVKVMLGQPYPSEPNAEGEGYAECDHCRRDFFCIARVVDGRLGSVEADLSRTAYVPDETVEAARRCQTCDRLLRAQIFRYRGVAHVYCEAKECQLCTYDVDLREVELTPRSG